jgi:hypothetical protein
MKKRISTSFKIAGYVLIGAALYMFTLIIHFAKLAIVEGIVYKKPLIAGNMFLFTCMMLLLAIFSLKVIEFDPEYVYITHRNKTKIISIEKVLKIKLTMIYVGSENIWKIKYLDLDDSIKSVRLLPNENFEEFVNLVKEKKPNVEFQNWSHSLDLDQ